jgi:hypothetical protein
MKKIPSESVVDGMVLVREVCGPSGSILVNRGTVLTAALGRRLTNWGIPFVFVEGEDENPTPESSDDTTPAELKTQLMMKFSNCIDNPLMKKIFVAAYQYRMMKKDE